MRRLRITLEFDALDETPSALSTLQYYLTALVRRDDLGTQIGPQDLERVGFTGVRLIGAEVVAEEGSPRSGD